MKANVYRFHVAYEGLEDKIWRDIEVSSNYFLNMLGYAVLATFDILEGEDLLELHMKVQDLIQIRFGLGLVAFEQLCQTGIDLAGGQQLPIPLPSDRGQITK